MCVLRLLSHYQSDTGLICRVEKVVWFRRISFSLNECKLTQFCYNPISKTVSNLAHSLRAIRVKTKKAETLFFISSESNAP